MQATNLLILTVRMRAESSNSTMFVISTTARKKLQRTAINNGYKYTYDANGNLVYINTSRVKKDGKEDEKATEQKYRWDEENRLLAADENGFVSNYWYDADGERTVKTSGENEAIYVNYRASRVQCQVCLSIAEAQPIITESNSEFSGGNTGTARFSLYVSSYLVAGQGGKYTKHIYVGSQRIVSKLGDLASYGADPRRIPYAGKILFLERGNANAGLQHIISRHGAEFAKAGISKRNIPKFIMQAILTGRKVGMQGSRPIYETTFNGTTHRVAVTVGNNGFVVGANMVSK